MTMYPGAGPQRRERSSRLMFHWRSSDGSLKALTGHPGVFDIIPSTSPSNVIDITGTSVTVGRGQPRWDQSPARGLVSRLVLEGSTAGKDAEYLWWTGWKHRIQAISLYWKVWPLYSPGQNVSASPLFGPMAGTNHTASGGIMSIARLGTSWQVRRARAGSVLISGFTESALTVYPIELLATLAAGGGVRIQGRDAAGATWDSGTFTDATMYNTAEFWGDAQVAANGIQAMTDADGGAHQHEVIKIARGNKTFPQIDLLS